MHALHDGERSDTASFLVPHANNTTTPPHPSVQLARGPTKVHTATCCKEFRSHARWYVCSSSGTAASRGTAWATAHAAGALATAVVWQPWDTAQGHLLLLLLLYIGVPTQPCGTPRFCCCRNRWRHHTSCSSTTTSAVACMATPCNAA